MEKEKIDMDILECGYVCSVKWSLWLDTTCCICFFFCCILFPYQGLTCADYYSLSRIVSTSPHQSLQSRLCLKASHVYNLTLSSCASILVSLLRALPACARDWLPAKPQISSNHNLTTSEAPPAMWVCIGQKAQPRLGYFLHCLGQTRLEPCKLWSLDSSGNPAVIILLW